MPPRLFGVRLLASLALAMAVVLAACAQGDAGPTGDKGDQGPGEANGRDLPSLYLDRSLEFLVGGVPTKREGYFERLQQCRDAGVAATPLSDAEAQLIDTGRRQYWRTEEGVAIREQRWLADRTEMCQFKLRQVGNHAYYDASGSVFLDLETGEVTTGPVSPRHLDRSRAGTAKASPAPDWTGPTKRKVAGQECEQWASPSGASVCTWSEGHQWGFVSTITSEYDESVKDVEALILEAAPAPGKVGIHVSTETFSVGGPIDIAAMRPAELAAGGEAP